MTKTQKEIVVYLLQGGSVAHLGKSGIRLRDNKSNPVKKLTPKTFRRLKDYLKKQKGLWVISRAAIRKESGKTWLKQEYKRFKNSTKKSII